MAADVLSLLVWLNLALAAAVPLVLVLRRIMRPYFGARVTYALWVTVAAAMTAAMTAAMLPARTIEVVTEVATTPIVQNAATVGGERWTQLTTIGFFDVSSLMLVLWLIGVVVMSTVLTFRQRAFVASLGRLSHETDGTLRAEATDIGPLILGALRPRLVLPKDFEVRFDRTQRDLVLAHERVHLRRRDALINALVSTTQCLCWFNPFVHFAARAMRIDQELACDAEVARQYPKARRIYAEAMLKSQITAMNLPVGCLWSANGTHPLKLRIAMLKRELPNTRRAAAGSLLATVACLTTGCSVWLAQPPREVEAGGSYGSALQPAPDAKLLRAVRQGNFRRAESAIGEGADVNVRSRSGMTALVIAARADDIRIVDLLLNHGAEVNATSPGEGNALVAAGRRGHVRTVAALIEHGARVNAIVPEYGTPLAASVRTGQLRAAQYLVEHGADVNLPSPLHRRGTVGEPCACRSKSQSTAITYPPLPT